MMAPASRHGRTVVLLRGRQGAIVPLLDGARSPTVGRWHAGGQRTVVLLCGSAIVQTEAQFSNTLLLLINSYCKVPTGTETTWMTETKMQR